MTETQRQAILAVHNARAELMMLVIIATVVIASAVALLWALRFAVIETLMCAPDLLRRQSIARAHRANNHTRPLPSRVIDVAAPDGEQARREPMRRAA